MTALSFFGVLSSLLSAAGGAHDTISPAPLWDKLMLRKRSLIETINDQLKNIPQIDPHIRSSGEIHAVYSEELDLGVLGPRSITRASHDEPDEAGKWLADLSHASGPNLGPFTLRSLAIEAEIAWLTQQLLTSSEDKLETNTLQVGNAVPSLSPLRLSCPTTTCVGRFKSELPM